MFLFFLLTIFLGVYLCIMCFLEVNYLLSCLFLSLSVVFFSPLLSSGCGRWYSYYVVLLFLSGIFSLMVYLSSLGDYSRSMKFIYYLLGFSLFLVFFLLTGGFYLDFMISDSGDLMVFNDYNYLFVFLFVCVLLLLLNIISYLVSGVGSLRGL